MPAIRVVMLPGLVVMLPGAVVILPGAVVMLPGAVVMLPGAKVVMLPANAVEAKAAVSIEAQRIDLTFFIAFLLVKNVCLGV